MHIEYKATCVNIKKEKARERLKQIGVIFLNPSFQRVEF